MAKDKRGPETPVRWFAHPQEDVLQLGHKVWIPGQEVDPKELTPEDWLHLKQDGLVIPEDLFKLHFARQWNQGHPNEQVADPEVHGQRDEAPEGTIVKTV